MGYNALVNSKGAAVGKAAALYLFTGRSFSYLSKKHIRHKEVLMSVTKVRDLSTLNFFSEG